MGCSPGFVKQIDWDCAKELIAHVRSGDVSVCCIEKGLWIAGCAVSMFAKDSAPGPFAESVEADRSVEDLCDALEALVPQEGFAADQPSKIDPEAILLIVQLIWKLVQALKK